ncbi:hypothetical protein BJ970_001649 [Saccharopolyspora phatthalungensis]|uniref:Uncharacterized protein n=1 Tax=Saccharopolyspora phatthalungensis TaxID=664693 RepID=A0A840Q6T3_9PSEU|nr:hypothetical protein [Saccharopolyspora phatthalungensis]
MIVATGILDREWRYARTPGEIRDLVRAHLSGHHTAIGQRQRTADRGKKEG